MHGLDDDKRQDDGIDDETERHRRGYYGIKHAWCAKRIDRNVGLEQDKLGCYDSATGDAIPIRLKKTMRKESIK